MAVASWPNLFQKGDKNPVRVATFLAPPSLQASVYKRAQRLSSSPQSSWCRGRWLWGHWRHRVSVLFSLRKRGQLLAAHARWTRWKLLDDRMCDTRGSEGLCGLQLGPSVWKILNLWPSQCGPWQRLEEQRTQKRVCRTFGLETPRDCSFHAGFNFGPQLVYPWIEMEEKIVCAQRHPYMACGPETYREQGCELFDHCIWSSQITKLQLQTFQGSTTSSCITTAASDPFLPQTRVVLQLGRMWMQKTQTTAPDASCQTF